MGPHWFGILVEAQELHKIRDFFFLIWGRDRAGHFLGNLTAQPFLAKRICLCDCGHCVRCHGPQGGEREGSDSRCGLTFLLRYLSSPLPLFVSLFVNDTDTLGHFSSNWLKKFKYRICGKMSHILKLYNLSYFFLMEMLLSPKFTNCNAICLCLHLGFCQRA